MNPSIATEINQLFDKNTLSDLQRFLATRRRLNSVNSYLIYVFHFVQSAGTLTTSFAAGNNDRTLIWLGVGLNALATLLHIYEKTNNSILKKLMVDIQAIKQGTFIDESECIDISEKKEESDIKSPLTNTV
jgi:hypothetical protein